MKFRTASFSGLITAAFLLASGVRAQAPPDAPRLKRPIDSVQPPTPIFRQQAVFKSSVAVGSPIEARVTWTDSTGAPGYDVLRNGAVVAMLGTADRAYVDATLRPNTAYVYQVQARTSPPPDPNAPQRLALGPRMGTLPTKAGPQQPETPPRVTDALQITTPRALPPQSVMAKNLGPGAVQVAWSNRPETLSYLIRRNDQTIRVTSNPAGGVYDDRNLAPGSYTYVVQAALRTADGVEVLGEPSRPITLLARPFNVLAFGDSVMWGQGLANGSKFVTRVQAWLQGQLGKEVRLLSFARSGAVYGPLPPQDETSAVAELSASSGEIPRSAPTIMNQALVLAPARINPAEVDLVLMDGCINDVEVMRILDPTKSIGEIDALTRQHCGPGAMDARLDAVGRTYPNARILITGYFPIISSVSDTRAVAVLLSSAGVLAAPVAALFGVPMDPVTGIIGSAITTDVLREVAASHSNTFHALSTSLLTVAVTTANARVGGNRVRLVNVPFTPLNAYAAPSTWLWLVPTPGVPLPNAVDEVFNERVQACSRVPNAPASCVPASMGHPNVQGAQAYANAITGTLGEFLGVWKTIHATAQFTQM
jgi:hypothetical protein